MPFYKGVNYSLTSLKTNTRALQQQFRYIRICTCHFFIFIYLCHQFYHFPMFLSFQPTFLSTKLTIITPILTYFLFVKQTFHEIFHIFRAFFWGEIWLFTTAGYFRPEGITTALFRVYTMARAHY